MTDECKYGCGRSAASDAIMDIHLGDEHGDGPRAALNNHACKDGCPRRFKTREQRDQHIDDEHSSRAPVRDLAEAASPPEKENAVAARYPCAGECDRDFPTQQGARAHFTRAHGHRETVEPDSADQSERNPYRVDLASGGHVALTGEINVFDLSDEDRSFVNDLLERFQGYSD